MRTSAQLMLNLALFGMLTGQSKFRCEQYVTGIDVHREVSSPCLDPNYISAGIWVKTKSSSDLSLNSVTLSSLE